MCECAAAATSVSWVVRENFSTEAAAAATAKRTRLRRLTKGFPWQLRRRVALLEIIYLEAKSIYAQRGGTTQSRDMARMLPKGG